MQAVGFRTLSSDWGVVVPFSFVGPRSTLTPPKRKSARSKVSVRGADVLASSQKTTVGKPTNSTFHHLTRMPLESRTACLLGCPSMFLTSPAALPPFNLGEGHIPISPGKRKSPQTLPEAALRATWSSTCVFAMRPWKRQDAWIRMTMRRATSAGNPRLSAAFPRCYVWWLSCSKALC